VTRGKINSRGMVVDYACGFAEYIAGVTAPGELADQSDLMRRNCDFNQYEVDRITYAHGLPEIHRDSGALMEISEMSVTYAKPQREDQLKRLLYLDRLLRQYPSRKIPDYDYSAIYEAHEMEEVRKRKEERAQHAAALGAANKTTTVITSLNCDVLKVR